MVRLITLISISLTFLNNLHGQMGITPSSPNEWGPGNVQQLTLVGALIIAVGVLWRALSSKDEALVNATKMTTEALVTAATTSTELRHIIEESVKAKKDLSESIDLLRVSITRLPCVVLKDIVKEKGDGN
jgi:hypothetical protein